MKPLSTMRQALYDQHLLGGIMAGDSWAGWRTLMIAAMGEALNDDERVIFQSLTGRSKEPLERVEELWAVVGRRGGKTRTAAVLAVYMAAFVDHKANLSPGERGLVLFFGTESEASSSRVQLLRRYLRFRAIALYSCEEHHR